MAKIRILYLEDSPLDAQVVMRMLNDSGITVDVVDNELDFKSALVSQAHDVIISDYIIPGSTAVSTIQMIKSVYPVTPVLFLTGSFDEKDRMKVLEAGAFDYIRKQDLEFLIPAIQNALQTSQSAGLPISNASDNTAF